MFKRGFTLVELLIVIIIVAVLAAVAIPKFQNSSQRAREAALRSQLKVTRDAIEQFRNDCDGWPKELKDLASRRAPDEVLNNGGNDKELKDGKFQGPYLLNVPSSPIQGGDLIYNTSGGARRVGTVTHTSGTALDGSDYADW